MTDVLSLPFFQRALLAGVLAAVACGVVGTYVVVKEFASISGGLAHAAFGGLGLGYLVGFSPMLGAAGFGLLSGLGIGVAYRKLDQGLETLVMIVWSVGMALGIVFVAAVPGYAPDLTTYLFGNILFVSPTYLWVTAGLDLLLLLVMTVFFRQLQGVAFDEEFAEVMGVNVDFIVLLLLALTSLVVVLLIRVVGVLLVIALLTIPAALARQWTSSLKPMMVLASLSGAFFIVGGLFVAYALSAWMGIDVPTGPVIVLLGAAAYGASAVLRRGRSASLGGRAPGGVTAALVCLAAAYFLLLLAPGSASGETARPALEAPVSTPVTFAGDSTPEPGAPNRRRSGERPRVREAGIVIGGLPPGRHNAITDVGGVQVGHYTLHRGDSLRTGVTAVLPHGGNLFQRKVPGAIVVGNGFGKLVGLSQVNELGEIETPILLTNTLSVFRAADALVDTMLRIPANRHVESINPVVGETNDGFLSDIRQRSVRPEHVRAALRAASAGPVEEGSVGAGTGTRTMGWKGGVGTASRVVSAGNGGDGSGEVSPGAPLAEPDSASPTAGSGVRGVRARYTVGVLVQTNFGGNLRVGGLPVWRELQRGGTGNGSGLEASRGAGRPPRRAPGAGGASRRGPDQGSVMIVVATDAPLGHLELRRLARRTFAGIARTGSHREHGSGDYAVAFSTRPYEEVPRTRDSRLLTRLFRSAIEATEEAVLNALFQAETVTGHEGHRSVALPVERVLEILRSHDLLGGTRP